MTAVGEDIRIRISPKQSLALHYLTNTNKTEVFYGGAAGGGKSFLLCLWQIQNRLNFPGTRGLIGRSKLKNLKLTTLKTFMELWERYFSHNEHGVTIRLNNMDNIIYFSNGSEIYLKDLFLYPSDPEFHSLGSMEITDAAIDEAPEIAEKAFNILKSRIRYKLINDTPKILLTGNPDHNWVKFRFVYDQKNQPVKLKPTQAFIPALVTDNPDSKFVQTYKSALEELPEADRQRLLHGNWLYNPNEKPFIYEFNATKHIASGLQFDARERLLLSFDFNYDPCTCSASQLITRPQDQGGGLFFMREWAVTGGTRELCREIKRTLPMDEFDIWVTGDSSGMAKSAVAGHINNYTIILEEFELSKKRLLDVSGANRKHEYSRGLCNNALYHIPFKIDSERCPMLLNDIRNAQTDENGKLLKDESRGIGMHLLDTFRYAVNVWFPSGNKSIKNVRMNINPNYYQQ